MRPNTNHEYVEDIETPDHCRLCDERPSADCHDIGFTEYPETSLPTETVTLDPPKPRVTRQDEVKVGQVWTISHGGDRAAEVKVLAVRKRETFKTANYTRPSHVYYQCVKLSTGKTIEVKSVAKFRRLVKDVETAKCVECNKEFNIPEKKWISCEDHRGMKCVEAGK